MTAMIIIEDNMTEGAVPMKGNISVDEDTGRVMIDLGDFSVLVPRDALEMVMYEDLHG